MRGAFYEPLIISSVAGGGHQYPWLAQSWKWSNGNKTLTLNLRKNVKWTDGKPLTSADVVYSLTAGKQDKTMDMIGYASPDTNVASIKASGPYKVVINLKTVDSQFIAAEPEPAVHRAEAHLVEGRRSGDVHEPEPGRIGPVREDRPLHTQDYVFNKNPNYWMAGAPKIPCLEYTQAASNDSALLPIQSGQVDWTHNFVPNVAKAYSSKDPAHYHAFYATTAYRSRSCSTPRSIRTASLRSGRRSASPSTGATCRSSVSTAMRRPPTRSA